MDKWSWTCSVAGYEYNNINCTIVKPGVCDPARLNQCLHGGLIDHPDTATDYKWECYVSGTEPDYCSLPIPKCGATPFACSGGVLGVQMAPLPNVYTWTCVSGDQFEACQLDRPMCSNPLVKNTCLQGLPQNPLKLPLMGPFQKITGKNLYTWECKLNNEIIPCNVTVDLCGAIEMKPGEECCNSTIINPDKEYCCDQDKADQENANEKQGIRFMDANHTAEMVCSKERQPRCFNRRLCLDVDGKEVHGEDGNPDPNDPDYADCNYEVLCAFAIMHSCDENRPNRNCQDECLALPKPAFCNTIINGVCDTPLYMCLAAFPNGIPVPDVPTNWWCIGSLADNSTVPATPP